MKLRDACLDVGSIPLQNTQMCDTSEGSFSDDVFLRVCSQVCRGLAKQTELNDFLLDVSK